jgi:ElaB/YqjD/DUF883 family membrane-anchored ribosome-binding protein
MAKKDKAKPETSGKDELADENAEQAAGEVGGLAANELKGLLEIVSDTYHMNRHQLTELVDGVREHARQRPFKSLLLAAGAGVLLGALLG